MCRCNRAEEEARAQEEARVHLAAARGQAEQAARAAAEAAEEARRESAEEAHRLATKEAEARITAWDEVMAAKQVRDSLAYRRVVAKYCRHDTAAKGPVHCCTLLAVALLSGRARQ